MYGGYIASDGWYIASVAALAARFESVTVSDTENVTAATGRLRVRIRVGCGFRYAASLH
jgi:hypothetical protein